MFERDSLNTRIVVQGSSDDVWNDGGRRATKRLVETLAHLKTPGDHADRLGLHPATLFGVACGFVAVLLFVIIFMFRFLGLYQ
jgi:hypothetical protein